MSDLNQIHTALNRLFNQDGQRIVFWNDPDQEFFMTIPLLELDGVTTLRPVKLRVTKPAFPIHNRTLFISGTSPRHSQH